MTELKTKIEIFCANCTENKDEAIQLFLELRKELEEGNVRAAEKVNNKWIVNKWVKQGILLGFKYGVLTGAGDCCGSNYYDKNTMPLRKLSLGDNIRMVPSCSSIRSGAYVAPGTVIMPPSYINIGSYVDRGCVIDSHALVGSCAQIGKNVHLSAASQIGGVLEPIGSVPVIVEDDVFIGGNCGIYEGAVIQEGAVIGTGVILNASTPVFDNLSGEFIKKSKEGSLIIPKNAVVVSGSRPISSGYGKSQNIHLYCSVIIKYRDSKTDKATLLEDILR